jgi:G3E family GTPase
MTTSNSHLSRINLGPGPIDIPRSQQLSTGTRLATTIWSLAGGYTVLQGDWGNLDAVVGLRMLFLGSTTNYQLVNEITLPNRTVPAKNGMCRDEVADSLMHTPCNATPLTILTGFLGAGKTTLLNRILNGDHGLRVAVLVNDFGPINIDAELVVGVQGGAVSLSNGCVCCQIQDDLLDALQQLVARPDPIDYVILEASGVADPAGIIVTFADEALRNRIRLDSITCVVDAEQIFANADQPQLVRLKMMQIACADMMLLNKVDLAGPGQVTKARAWIDEHFNRVRIIETTRCDVPLDVLLGAGRFDPAVRREACDHHRSGSEHHGAYNHSHGEMFSTWSFETGRPISTDALRQMARLELPASVYRCKGIVHTDEAPERRAVLQVVGRRADVSPGDPWGDQTPRTRIVAIGAKHLLNADLLRGLFERCLVSTEPVG